jgi:hypothetical protein
MQAKAMNKLFSHSFSIFVLKLIALILLALCFYQAGILG